MEDDLITPSDFFHRGLESLERGKYSEALQYFEAAVAGEYFDADIHVPMGEALFEVGRYEDALRHFEQAQTNGAIPASEALLWKGQCYHEMRRFRRALSAFNRVLEADPNRAEAHFKRGLSLVESGAPEKALLAFEHAERLLRQREDSMMSGDPAIEAEALAEVMLWRGRVVSRMGRRADGLELMFKAYELAPDHPGPYHELADSFRISGDMATAEEWYRKGLERLPEDPSLHNDFGNLLRDLGRYRESVKHLTFAIEHDATRTVAYYNRALSLEHLELYDEALKDYDIVIESSPSDLEAKLRKLDLLARLSMFSDAEQLLSSLTPEEMQQSQTRDARARLANRRAMKAEEDGDIDTALMFHHAALKLHPDFLDVESPAPSDNRPDDRAARIVRMASRVRADAPNGAVAALVHAAARVNRRRLAGANMASPGTNRSRDIKRIEELLETARLDPACAPVANKLMAEIAYFEYDEDERAIKLCDQALADAPDYIAALWIKATVLSDGMGRPDLAVTCYKRMLEITPENPGILVSIGDMYFDLGAPQRALAYYRRVVLERPGDISVHRDIGLCYLALRRYGEAIATFSNLEAQGVLQLDVRLDLAEAHLALGERAEAAAIINSVIEENEDLDPVIETRATELSAALSLSRRNPKQALSLLREVSPDLISTYGMLQLARALIALKRFPEAELYLERIVSSLGPTAADAVEARMQMVRVAFATGDQELAHQLLDQLAALAPFDERVYRQKCWLLMLEGRMDEHDKVTEDAKFAIHCSKVHRLMQYEEYDDALRAAEELQQDFPRRIEPAYFVACNLAQLGEDDRALECLRDLLRRQPALREQMLHDFYLEPLRLADRIEFRGEA